MTSTRSTSVRSLALVSCLVFAVVVASTARAAHITALYAFGDSLSDLGNTYNELGGSGADSAIYSILGYTAQPGRYDAGRWSNGPLWVEHLNNQLGLPALARNQGGGELATGTNFAYGGSTTGTGHTAFILANLQRQVINYLVRSGGSGSPTALYSVWSGGNDVINYISDDKPNTPAGIDQLTTTMADNITIAVTNLYNAGARQILVPNLPALGDKPSYVDTPDQAFANSIVEAFNPKLEQSLIDLRTQHTDIHLIGWDVYSSFNAILDDPASYGFTNVKDAAFSSDGAYPGTVAADPNKHVFWDGTHPTAAGHALLGQFAYEAISVLLIPEPSTLVLVNVSLAFACGRVRAHRRW